MDMVMWPHAGHASPCDVLFLLLVGQLQLAALSDAHPCWRAGLLLLPGSCLAGRAHLHIQIITNRL